MTRDDMLDCLRYNLKDLKFARGSDYSGVEAIEMAIKILEAQPEIVRCKKCRHSVDYYHDGECYCSNPEWGLMFFFGGSWEFYCAAAERRTEHEHEENLGKSRNEP